MNTSSRLQCKLTKIHTFFPDTVLDNAMLARRYQDWSEEKIFEKTGIRKRHVVGDDQYVSDLATNAARSLFEAGTAKREEIDALIICTQTPDFALPCTAALVHRHLELPVGCMTFDFNHGCTGFIYGLSIAGSLVHSGQAGKVLLITAETYTRLCHPKDKSVTTIFGDGAAAVVVEPDRTGPGFGPFLFGSDGRGFDQLTIPVSGAHAIDTDKSALEPIEDQSGNVRTGANLYMNGPELFRFAITSVPKLVKRLLEAGETTMEEVDAFVFHQANAFMLQNIQKKLRIPDEKMIYALEEVGNTVSASIPVAIGQASVDGRIRKGGRLLLIGFGVGYSWGGCFLTWNP